MEKNPIPAHLTLDEQGIFVLGYYHQRAAFYVSKTDNNRCRSHFTRIRIIHKKEKHHDYSHQ